MSVVVRDLGVTLIAAMMERTAEAAMLIAEAIVADADTEGRIPNQDGDLRRSGHAVKDGNSASCIWDVPYAAYQYYTPELVHPKGGGPWWAERTANTNGTKYLGFLKGMMGGVAP